MDIEKNVPIPPRVHKKAKYPFMRMEVGDSVWIDQSNASVISAALSYARRKTGNEYTQRAERHGVRVWRVS